MSPGDRQDAEEEKMRTNRLTAGSGTTRSPLPRLLLIAVLAALGVAGTAAAQSFLGTIRGTVVDPQGGVVPGASVLIVDESTGVPRTVGTDAEGRFEATNLRSGTYRVEIVTTSFKKYEATGVVVRAAGVSRVDAKLELGAVTESVTVSAEAQSNITIESPAVIRGLDTQQLRDLPRSSRDMQSFLLLNPNVVGGTDDIQFLGGRTYGVSYIQDGQSSTNVIFGTIGNSAPGLDAIAEIEVLSNSYSAEYGGLAGVVVTTKRGGNDYRGQAFYDFNANELNALTYNQKLSGVTRDDPNTDTHQHRWGFSLGGPVKTNKTFFFFTYEGSNDKAIYGGSRSNVPTAAMRAGDFSANSFKIRDPLTGQNFPGNVIPASRIDPSATKILNDMVPLPNQGTLSNGLGVFQEFVPETRKRHRADLRFDIEASPKDSIFLRGGIQYRNPNNIAFAVRGNSWTNLPIYNDTLWTGTGIGGWTRVFSPTVVNELRIGYNYDARARRNPYRASEKAALWGIENAPTVGDRYGFPSMTFSGSNRPANIQDDNKNVDRETRQNSFSISNNTTFVLGGHSLKAGALWNRNLGYDGYGIGVNYRGLYEFNGARTGNAFSDFLLGLPRRVSDHSTARGPLEGHTDDFAVFAQDDWRVNKDLTIFLGLRYELVGWWHENSNLIADFLPEGQGFHVVPSAEVASKLAPGVLARGTTRLASDVGLPAGTLLNTDKNNFSPRVGFAWRLGDTGKTVLRGGFGLFHPTVAVQGVRDLMTTNNFRYYTRYYGGGLRNGFSGGTPETDYFDTGTQGMDPNIQSPDIYQYNLTLEREIGDFGLRVSYIGSTMRKLLTDSDKNIVYPSATDFGWDPFDPEQVAARVPFPLWGWWMDFVENKGEGQFHAGQIELRRRWKNGLAFETVYTYAHSDSTVPDSGNSSIGVVLYNPWDPMSDRGPDPNVVKHRFLFNGTWDVPVGKGRKHGSAMPAWADALFGGWTVSTLFQARSGLNLTPFFYGFYSSNPWGTGKPLDGLGNAFCCAWRPDQISDPNQPHTRDKWFDQMAYAMPGPGQFGNAKKGSLTGPGTWVMNFAFYKDIVARGRFRLQLTALLDNAFNHPQFFPGYGTDFHNMGDLFENGIEDNGVTGVLGADTIGNAEGFSPGRTFRLGIRATF
jgi:outer membrane receptor protein involved in Fe transport